MNTPETPSSSGDLPSEVRSRLQAVQERELRFRWLHGFVRSLALALGVMLGAIALDWAFGWLSASMRWFMTVSALGTAAAGLILWLILPVLRRPNQVAVARTVDEKVPALEERWSTVTQLSSNQDAPEVRGSESLIQAVTKEADKLKIHVDADKLISMEPVRLASRWLAGAAAVFLIFLAWDFPQAKILLTRFWLPSSDASLTQIKLVDPTKHVPIHEPLELNARIEGRLPSEGATIILQNAEGELTEHLMTASTEEPRAVRFPISSVRESFSYRIESGDGRTDWQPVTALSRPAITDIQLTVEAPEYAGIETQELSSLPHRVRLLEGSRVDLRVKADQELETLYLDREQGEPIALTLGKDGWYHYEDQPETSMAFQTVLRNAHQLENKIKPASRFVLYEDLPPTVRVLDPTDDIAKRPDDTVTIEFEALDDFGLESAELIVTQTDELGNVTETRLPIELEEGTNQVQQEVELDLAPFDLKQGDQLSYQISVTDTKQEVASSAGSDAAQPSDSPFDPSETNPEEQLAANDNGEAQEPQESQDGSESSDQESQQASQANQDSQPNEGQASPSSSPQMAAKPNENEEEKKLAAQTTPPPPNDMAKRMLDAGQCSSCQPRNIQIDEWAGSFDGENKEKLQLAIDPVLERLKGLLQEAQTAVGDVQATLLEARELNEAEKEATARAKDALRQSDSAVEELVAKSAGTPYAFIGLQLDNINFNHIAPARDELATLSRNEPDGHVEALQSGAFHIERALAMLEDLTRSYEEVKREQKIADAMQKLAKMHQIFLEDTQAMLGSKKGPINKYNRKIAEVDEDYVEALKKLLEEKKKVMDELAKLLAEDPRMLRRFLALQQLEATSYRDQMTLLAERQGRLKTQVNDWADADEATRETLLESYRVQYAADASTAFDAATKLHENMETWLPLDVDPKHEEVTPLTGQAEALVLSLGQSIKALAANDRTTGIDHGNEALSNLRSLHEQLPLLNESIPDEPKMPAYVANRLEEVERLISLQSGWLRIMQAMDEAEFASAAEVVQHTLAQDTQTLSEKIVITKDQVSSMSEEIADVAEDLVRIVQTDIIHPQTAATEYLQQANWEDAKPMETHLVTAFALAEERFDTLLNLIIAKLDEAPAPTAGGGSSPTLDDLLTMLENEKKAQEGLGIPCRPINVSVMKDWMKPSSGSMPGSSMAQAQAKAAQAQAAQAQKEADKLQKAANAKAKGMQAKYKRGERGGSGPNNGIAGPAAKKKSWNVLVSQLEKDILQGRDNVPPERYRNAIDSYFQRISESIPSANQ